MPPAWITLWLRADVTGREPRLGLRSPVRVMVAPGFGIGVTERGPAREGR
jgi:hypothetical protein